MRCSVYIATSLDGYIARKNGGIDWLSIVERAGEDYGYQAFWSTVDTLVVGRKTYETALGFGAWPYAGKRCVVMTHHPPHARHGERFEASTPAEIARSLEKEGSKRIYVDGGSVIRQFLDAGLVTDLTLSTIPILLGDGVRLFDAIARETRLELGASRSFSSGLVQSEYRVQS